MAKKKPGPPNWALYAKPDKRQRQIAEGDRLIREVLASDRPDKQAEAIRIADEYKLGDAIRKIYDLPLEK